MPRIMLPTLTVKASCTRKKDVRRRVIKFSWKNQVEHTKEDTA